VGIFGQKMNITQFEHGKVSITNYSKIHEFTVCNANWIQITRKITVN